MIGRLQVKSRTFTFFFFQFNFANVQSYVFVLFCFMVRSISMLSIFKLKQNLLDPLIKLKINDGQWLFQVFNFGPVGIWLWHPCSRAPPTGSDMEKKKTKIFIAQPSKGSLDVDAVVMCRLVLTAELGDTAQSLFKWSVMPMSWGGGGHGGSVPQKQSCSFIFLCLTACFFIWDWTCACVYKMTSALLILFWPPHENQTTFNLFNWTNFQGFD